MSDPLNVNAGKSLPDKKLKLAAINVNSITSPGRIDELQCFVDDNSIDILALSELKIDSTVHPGLYTLTNFHSPIVKPRTRRGGGTGIFISKSLPFKRMTSLENDDIEALWVKIKIKGKLLVICSTYLPPHTPADKQERYLEHLTDGVTQARALSPELIVIMGDLNGGNCWLPPGAPKHSPINSFEGKLQSTSESLGLTQLIKEATRVQDGTHNIRDLIFVDSPDTVMQSGTLSSFSNLDHFPIYVALSLEYLTTKMSDTTEVLDYSNTDINALIDRLSGIDWDSITGKDVDEATEAFTETLLDTAYRCIPTKVIRVRQNKLWVTADLRRQIRKRDRLFRQARSRQTEYDWARWRTQRNLVTSINRKLKRKLIQEKVNILLSCRKDPFKYHSIIKSITGIKREITIPPLIDTDGTILNDNRMKAEALNSYFRAQTEIQITELQRDHLRDYESIQPKTPFHLETIAFTTNEVLTAINGLDASKACGPDKLSSRLLKMTAIYIAEPLTLIFNKSLSEGRYPNIWKRANVKPVFKGKGSPSELQNYRPISLLPCVSKIFEKLIFNKIYEHLSTYELLSDYQSGYRPGHSTQLQLVYLTDKLYKSLDKLEDFTVVYLDISRYFEKIWHDGLIAKCKSEFGITGEVLCWLKSYLVARSQTVQVGTDHSNPLTLSAGVPQGSVLGPLLAIMYLNGLSEVTSNQMLYFADDSSLHCSHTQENVSSKEAELQRDLDAIHNYGLKWAITFNTNKTAQQTFTNRRNVTAPALTFNGQQIPLTAEHKHLGLTFSSDLKFKRHVNEALLKFNRALSPLYQTASYIPRRELIQIYTTYVQPHLDYCSAVYGGNLTTFDSTRLEKAQNRAARLITGTVRRTHVAGLREELGWSSVADRRKKDKLLLFHRLVHDHVIPEFIRAIAPNTREAVSGIPLRSTTEITLRQPGSRTAAYSRSFVPSTTRCWNELPTELRLLDSHKRFKKKIGELMGPDRPNPFYIYGSKRGNILHTRLRLNASSLKAHRFSFGHIESPQCLCGYKNEDTTHFLLHCPQYDIAREELYDSLTTLLRHNFKDLFLKEQINIMLNGPQGKPNQNIASKVAIAIQTFINKTNRFGSMLI